MKSRAFVAVFQKRRLLCKVTEQGNASIADYCITPIHTSEQFLNSSCCFAPLNHNPSHSPKAIGCNRCVFRRGIYWQMENPPSNAHRSACLTFLIVSSTSLLPHLNQLPCLLQFYSHTHPNSNNYGQQHAEDHTGELSLPDSVVSSFNQT